MVKQSNGLEFFYDHTGIAGLKYGGSTYVYRKDAQGNIIAIINQSGNVVVEYTYDAWGKVLSVGGNTDIGKGFYKDWIITGLQAMFAISFSKGLKGVKW